MMEWLSGIVGEHVASFLSFIIIFAIILGGIVIIARLLRSLGRGAAVQSPRTRQPRLSVVDAAAVDSRRKLVLIRRDEVEHLLLIGGPSDIVVEQNIVLEQRAQPSRLEAEHLEIFRQHEAILADEQTERVTLPQDTEKAPAKDDTIQLSSAIERPVYRMPEPVVEPIKTPEPTAPRAFSPPPSKPAATVTVMREQSRPQPNYPPQPRTVLPERPAPAQQTAPRAHPAYPLNQVSRGVVSATSAAASAANASLTGVVPQREPSFPTGPSLTAEAPKSAATDFSATRQSTSAPHSTRVEPEIAPKTPTIEDFQIDDDGLEGLGGALHDAIMADLEAETQKSVAATDHIAEVDLFESELLGSLDISADGEEIKADTANSFEDEMQKLLGDLTATDKHRS